MGGSTNWTNPTNLFNDYNNIIFIQDKSIAQAYTAEFNEMWGGVFGSNKEDNTPHLFNVNGTIMEVYFSPSDQTTSKILKFIEDVNYTLEFGLLSFTRDDLGNSVINKDNEFGVNVRGIIEQQNVTGSEYNNLINNGVNVQTHMGIPNQFHHKYAIADVGVSASNPSVLTGSHNWSTNAESNSDENTIIIHDHAIANIYLQEFEERWNELATSVNELSDVKIEVFPNPSDGNVNIITESMIEVINIYDIEGKFVQSTISNDFEILSSGVYFIKITLDNGNNTIRKVIIQ